MVIYDRIAPYYNRALSRPFFAYLRPAVSALMKKHGVKREASVLEVACGPGHLSSFLKERGFKLAACDISILQHTSSPHRYSFPFAVSRMQALPFKPGFDLILNLYDSLNHLLTVPDLFGTFGQVHQLLKPSGIFIFDTNSKLAFKRIWANPAPYVHEEEDFKLTMETTYSSRTRLSEAIVTVKADGEEIVSSFQERYFTPREIKKGLKEAGLKLLEKIPWCPSKKAYHGYAVKDLWIARKE